MLRLALLGSMLFATGAFAAGLAQGPRLLDRTPITYPPSELPLKKSGFVTIAVEVLENGSVGATRVERSSNVEAFDQAALIGVRRWVFEPARDADGKPVASSYGAVIAFRPDDAREWSRLMRIYHDYHFFVGQNDAIATRCEQLGIDASAGRKAVEPDEATRERERKLAARFRELLTRGQGARTADREAYVDNFAAEAHKLASDITDQKFARWSPVEAKKHCQETLASMIELGFFYEGSDELMEF